MVGVTYVHGKSPLFFSGRLHPLSRAPVYSTGSGPTYDTVREVHWSTERVNDPREVPVLGHGFHGSECPWVGVGVGRRVPSRGTIETTTR